MDAAMLRDLELRLSSLERTSIRYRAGTVTATSPLSVSLGAATVAYTNVKSVALVVTGDVVACIVWGNDLVVLGKLGTGSAEAWHNVGGGGEPAFVNSWTNHASGNYPAQFRRRPDGTVEVRGLIVPGTVNAAAFTLPAGYRPVGQTELYFPSISSTGGYLFGSVAVYSSGEVRPVSSGTSFISLDGIMFSTG